jgi:hypothetical protein
VGGGLLGSRDDEEEVARSVHLTPYRALAVAVRSEERVFTYYTYIAAHAPSAQIRALAEEFAVEALHYAVALRRKRREAFHTERPAAPVLPATVAELHAVAAALDGLAGKVNAMLAEQLAADGHASDAQTFRQLADEEGHPVTGATPGAEATAVTVAEGVRILERAFERYIDIAERATQENVVSEAQQLAEIALRRMSLTYQVRDRQQTQSNE